MLSLLLSSFALAWDVDGDGVGDAADRCSFEDDSVDIDGNGTADCAETLLAEFGFEAHDTLSIYDLGPYPVWDPDDLHGYANSGSVMVQIAAWPMVTVTPCVSVDDAYEYVLSARVSASAPNTHHWLYFDAYSGPDCGGTHYSAIPHQAYGETFTAFELLDLTTTFRPQPWWRSIRIRTYQEAPTAYRSARGWVDSLSIHSVGTVPSGDDTH